MKKFEDYYQIETLKDFSINHCVEFFCVIEFYPHTGPRGNHIHQHKVERLWVLEGCLQGDLWFPDTHQKINVEVQKNQLIIIYPGVAHGFRAFYTKATALEFSFEKLLIDDNTCLTNPFV